MGPTADQLVRFLSRGGGKGGDKVEELMGKNLERGGYTGTWWIPAGFAGEGECWGRGGPDEGGEGEEGYSSDGRLKAGRGRALSVSSY